MLWFVSDESHMVTTSIAYVQYTYRRGDGCVLASLKSASVAANLVSGHYTYMCLMVDELALSAMAVY